MTYSQTSAADVTACLGSRLLSQAVKNDSIKPWYDRHIITFALANYFNIFQHRAHVCVCVFFFISSEHEGEKTPVNQTSEEELPDYLM